MEQKAGVSYSYTADYTVIEAALKSRWDPFLQLEQEMHSFVPRSLPSFAEYREKELSRLQRLNPNSSPESLLDLIDRQIAAQADPAWQFHYQFSDRLMSEYVTVAFLAHALAEAAINAFLAIGLSVNGTSELFDLIEHADIKEKWLVGPKTFHRPYELKKDAALFQTLQHLVRQRNSFVHYKIELEMDGETKVRGSRLDRSPLHVQATWIRRYFSLPYDLAAHARRQLPPGMGLVLYNHKPIELFAGHQIPSN